MSSELKTGRIWRWRYFGAWALLTTVSTAVLGLGWVDGSVWATVTGGAWVALCGGAALRGRGGAAK